MISGFVGWGCPAIPKLSSQFRMGSHGLPGLTGGWAGIFEMPGCAHCVSRITRTSGMPCLSVGLCSPCELSLVAYSSTP